MRNTRRNSHCDDGFDALIRAALQQQQDVPLSSTFPLRLRLLAGAPPAPPFFSQFVKNPWPNMGYAAITLCVGLMLGVLLLPQSSYNLSYNNALNDIALDDADGLL